MKMFVQEPARSRMNKVATFKFVSENTMRTEDPILRELVRDMTEGKMNIFWKDGIICADCPSGDYALMTNDQCGLDLFLVTNFPMSWKVGDCANEPKELLGDFKDQ